MINLRHYQEEAVARVRVCFRNVIKSVLFVLATGGGKTVVFTYIAQQMSFRKKRALILVHRVELLRQTSAALNKFDVEHGMINPLYSPSFDNYVQVASVQTIINRLNYLQAVNWIPDLIIVDESHHATAGSWRKIINHFSELNPKMHTLGVTATPIRSDGQGLGVHHGGLFEDLVLGPTPKWLMEEGYLVKAKVLSPPKQFDPSVLKRKRGDYNARDLENLVNKPVITGDAIDHYEQTCKGAPTIVFCVSVAHTEEVAQAFRERGYRFYAIDGTTEDETRKRILNGLADGSVQGVCSCDLINEGTDVPAATAAILLRYTQSLGLHLQQIGRVLRPVYAPGYNLETREGRLAAIAASEKPYAYVLDHVGNVGSWVGSEFIPNHGLPEEEHEWSLDGEVKKRGKKKNEEAPIRIQQCLSCYAVHEPSPVCPECGHVYEIRNNKPKHVEGQLQEVTEDKIQKKEKRQEVGQAESLDDLRKIAEERGYKEGWVGVQYKMKKSKFEAIARRKEEREALELENEWNDNLEF